MSLKSSVSQFWNCVQCRLFPLIERDLGSPTESHKKLAAILELIRIEDSLPCTRFNFGRPQKDRAAIARAFVAKRFFKLTYTKELIERLNIDLQLRYMCGWEFAHQIPSESKFSRVFEELSEISLPDVAHQKVIKEFYHDEIVGHVTRDYTPIEVREKALKKKKGKKKKYGGRRQRQLQESDLSKMIEDLPTACDIGMKISANGYKTTWKGFKLHAAVDQYCIPLAAILTSASLNDCEAAIPLGEKCNQVVTNLYDLMDAAYDHPEIREHSTKLNHIALIDKCPHGKAQKDLKEAEKKRRSLLNFETAEQQRYKSAHPGNEYLS